MRKSLRYIFLLICCAGIAQAQEVTSTINGAAFVLGDYIVVEQHVQLNEGKIIWPDAKQPLEGLELLSEKKDTTGKDVRRTLTYIQFDSGEYLFPAMAVTIAAGSDTTIFETPVFPYYVSSIALDTTGTVRSLKDRLDVQYRPIPWALFSFIALCLVMLLGWLLYRYLSRKPMTDAPEIGRPEPVKPIYQHAMERLEELESQKLWQQEKIKPYYSELTDIIREYIQFRFSIPVLERTTEEVAESLMLHPVAQLPEKNRDEIIKVLRLADMVKFAKASPLPDQHSMCMVQARDLLEKTKPSEIEGAVQNVEKTVES